MNYIDSFFLALDKEIESPLKIILTGAMAGIILGSIRPSMDIDFEIEFSPYEKQNQGAAQKIQEAISRVSKKVRLPAQYSENIQGWSQISFLNYRETSLLYKKIGKIEVRYLSCEHWTIGKIARYLPLDKMDVSFVLKNKPIPYEKIISIWARAVKNSALSDRSGEFKNHAIDFIKHEGGKIWGNTFDSGKAIEYFKKETGILEKT